MLSIQIRQITRTITNTRVAHTKFTNTIGKMSSFATRSATTKCNSIDTRGESVPCASHKTVDKLLMDISFFKCQSKRTVAVQLRTHQFNWNVTHTYSVLSFAPSLSRALVRIRITYSAVLPLWHWFIYLYRFPNRFFSISIMREKQFFLSTRSNRQGDNNNNTTKMCDKIELSGHIIYLFIWQV